MGSLVEPRSNLLKLALAAVALVITARLFTIQILQHEKWVEEAANQQTMQNTIMAKRGEIYMMDAVEGDKTAAIVMNEPVWTVWVDPMTADPEKTKEVIDRYAGGEEVADWRDVFADKKLRYYVVARNVKRKAAEEIKAAGLIGVGLKEGVRRVYPEGQMATPLLGFVNAEGEGQYGVEGYLNEELAGENGLLKTIKDINNVPLTIGDENVRVPAKDGKNIVLTIDRNIQRNVEKILANAMVNSGTTHAAAVVMNPQNGKVWAMANMPTYDATNYAGVDDITVFQNGVAETAFEPGSVFKTFAMAVAIDQKVMTPETTYYNTGSTTVDGWPINNVYKGSIGATTMQTALNYSLNTGSVQSLRLLGGSETNITQLGKDRLYDYYYKRFGFGQYTGVEVAEGRGIVVPSDDVDGTDARYANMTFGQGLDVTMLQVAAALSAVVNGGDYYQPTVVEGEMVNGELKRSEVKAPVREAISAETSTTMRRMLYGTRLGRRTMGIDRTGYYVGGKTGTAQAIKNGAYVMEETLATYVGFGMSGTTENDSVPEYVIMVKIWEEGKKIEGEKDAMPIFDEISNYLQDYLKIKPKE